VKLQSLSLLVAIVVSGCAADHTLEDWRRDKLQEQLGKLAPISGSFRGTLKAKDSSEPLAAMELSFSPQVRVIPGGPSEKAQGQPVLSAKLQFDDRTQRLAVSSPDSFFDPATGKFNLTLQLRRKSGRTEEIQIGGYLQEDRLEGTLEVLGAGQTAGSFTLARTKSSSGSLTEVAQKLKITPWSSVPANQMEGSTTFANGQIRSSKLVIFDPETAPEEAFLNRFAPTRVVQMTVSFGDSLKLVHDSANWDERTRKLTGRATLAAGSTGGTTAEVTTECTLSDSMTWSCAHLVSGLGQTGLSEYPGASRPTDSGTSALNHLREGTIVTASRQSTGVWMQLTRAAQSRADEVIDLINPRPEKFLTLSLQFAAPGGAVQDRVTVVFEQARLDQHSHTLDGRAQLRASGGGAAGMIEVTLHCSGLLVPGLDAVGSLPGLTEASCQYWSTQLATPLDISFPAKLN